MRPVFPLQILEVSFTDGELDSFSNDKLAETDGS